MSRVTILGTGRMGSAMAQRLVLAGHDVRLWNRNPDRALLAAESGGVVATSAGEAVRDADVVLSVLSNGDATQAVLGSDEVLTALTPASIVCDMATSGPVAARAVAELYASRDLHFVDSPVAGSVPSVLSGTLLVMASGQRDDVDAVTPIMEAFAKKVVYLGPAGNGQSMKLAAGLVVHTLNSAVSEGLALASASGISREAAYEVFLSSSVAAPYVGYKQAAFLTTNDPVAMSLDLVAKDLGLIREQGESLGLELATLDGVAQEIAHAREAGFGASDMADVLRYVAGEGVPQRP